MWHPALLHFNLKFLSENNYQRNWLFLLWNINGSMFILDVGKKSWIQKMTNCSFNSRNMPVNSQYNFQSGHLQKILDNSAVVGSIRSRWDEEDCRGKGGRLCAGEKYFATKCVPRPRRRWLTTTLVLGDVLVHRVENLKHSCWETSLTTKWNWRPASLQNNKNGMKRFYLRSSVV